jgi:hypothetical protein
LKLTGPSGYDFDYVVVGSAEETLLRIDSRGRAQLHGLDLSIASGDFSVTSPTATTTLAGAVAVGHGLAVDGVDGLALAKGL